MRKVRSSLVTVLATVLLMGLGSLLVPVSVAYAATITVTTTADELNTNSKCSLREAIRAANLNTRVGACPAGSSSGTDTISVPAGTYILTITGMGEQAAQTGDLDVTGPTKIAGVSAANTIIDGNRSDRVLDVKNGATLSLVGVTLQNGKTFSSHGAGIYNGGTLKLDGVVVRNNNSDRFGGGIYNATSRSLTITNSTLSGNLAHEGGGIYTLGPLKVTYSTVKDNSASGVGGGIQNVDGTLEVFKTTINGNNAGTAGGGIANNDTATLTNSTVSSNTSIESGGGIVSWGPEPTLALYNSTVTLNNGQTGGIWSASWGITMMANTIVAGNTGTAEGSPDCYGTITSQGYNLIGNTTNCTITGDTTGNKLNVAAKLGPLQNNGGPTFTHALLSGSAAIDAGNPAAPGNTTTACSRKDQRDVSRPRDGNDDGKARCDMGAVERP
jgi:CSLREA domain-containing protein